MKRIHRIISAMFLVGLVVLALLLYRMQGGYEHPISSTPGETTMTKPSQEQTILITGFEPFGGSSVNASWEGAALLDGRVIAGFRIVAMKLPVVWGKPLEVLDSAIANYKPVAVFSFGQAPGSSFRIETYARNRRGFTPDNSGAAAHGGFTAPGGPEHYQASHEKLDVIVDNISQSYPISVSIDAGNYLCEECLYSLEHLRATKYPHLKVMFCHVPTLSGQTSSGEAITPKYISEFIEALITKCTQ